ncbi:MAG: sigma-70 family RNA polymerase sigma factor [Candidatus Methylomirabilis sp.]|nr:sigma-70 family RNA polymerase sigma factor [Deltaproteobacteria bacterium]
MERTDAELVRHAQKGDQDAFRALLERYERKVFSVALGMVQSPDDAMDVTQEAFISAYRSLGRFRGESTFYTWLCRIAINLAIDFKRRGARSLAVDPADLEALEAASPAVDGPEDPNEAYFQTERREAILKAVDELPPAQRAAIILREVDGLAYEEIAQVLKISKGTVMSRLHYARKKLQARLEPYL